ncbi:glucoside xylosyltransferase 1 shams isoform X1 [Rhodnius prolixus]|uniref:UDP-D-xylose:beta-D-glucoside alpha-1,3-D-xylosyltransferase n=1 Tax=Rhodnius prolixus TaxID=13249 RepID=A0A4P6D939_RHOPR
MKLIYRVSVFALLVIITYIVIIRSGNGYLSVVLNMTIKEGKVNRVYFVDKSVKNTVVDMYGDSNKPKHEIVLSVVVCGDRVQETLVMIKSALSLSQDSKLRLIILAEEKLVQDFIEKLTEWKNILNGSFTFETRPVSFPKSGEEEWKKLFKPCASQRLFLPSVLVDVDSVLYVDTDVLFLSPPENVWRHFDLMNSTQLAALAPEHEDPNIGWYNRFARHPYYGKLGVNSGVMLMNLTRMRDFGWEKYLVPILKEYKLKMTWGDQDIINIIFHYHPECLYIYDCSYNYRSDHCMYSSVCKAAHAQGVKVLHGSRSTFHTEKQPAFSAVFRAFQEYQLGTDAYQYLYLPMESYLKQATVSNCGKVHSIFLKQIKEFVGDGDYFS